MKKIEAHLSIEINVECPHCEDYINLLDGNLFPHLNDEGTLFKQVFRNDGFGCNNLNEEITCPNCQKEFIVESVWW